jgi:outer membrane lipoprotein-sorting protein
VKEIPKKMTRMLTYLVFAGVTALIGSFVDIASYKNMPSPELYVNASTVPKKNFDRDLNAESVIRKVIEKYSSAKILSASGINTYFKQRKSGPSLREIPFKMEYSQPSRIAISWKENGESRLLSTTNEEANIYANNNLIKHFDDALTGVQFASDSDGHFFEAGWILLQKERDAGEIRSFNTLNNLKIVGTEVVDERVCYVLQGTSKNDDLLKITFWIDTESFLIRKYERFMQSNKYSDIFSRVTETYTNIETQSKQ